jgi:hypothetical protein
MKLLQQLAKIRRLTRMAIPAMAVACSLSNANADFTFTPGHIYTTYDEIGNTRDIIEYSETGTVLGSLTVPSLLEDDELRGIAFGPDGLLYAVMLHFADSGFTVLALDNSGTVHAAYRMDGIYIWGGGSYGKIAVDQQNIYVAGAAALVCFTIGDPNSGMVLYAHDQIEDVKILPTGHFFVAWDYGVDEITSTGTFVRTVVSSNGIDFVNILGIEYNPATNKLFLTQLGTTGSKYSILRVNASTGEIETGTAFNYAGDLFLTQSGTLLVGSWVESARIYDQDLMFVSPLGADQRFFVTQYLGQPTPTPTPRVTPRPKPTPAPRPTPR